MALTNQQTNAIETYVAAGEALTEARDAYLKARRVYAAARQRVENVVPQLFRIPTNEDEE